MPGPGTTLAKAKLIEMVVEGDTMRAPPPSESSATATAEPDTAPRSPHQIEVQFNPETLKVNYANQNAGGESASGGPRHFVGTSTTKLSVELVFDVSLPLAGGQQVNDVRALTTQIAYFLRPKGGDGDSAENRTPPGVSFSWGEFQFDGVMDSMDETLELFSADGRALRATVSLSMSKQEIIHFEGGRGGSGGGRTGGGGGTVEGGSGVGTERARAIPEGVSLQQALAQTGQLDWQPAALASGIEDPRRITRGTLLRAGAASRQNLRRLGVL